MPDASVPQPPCRIGHGYDLHRLEAVPAGAAPHRPLVIAGRRFDEPVSVVGHSDGDVVYHAATDAILGALGDPDLGSLFPDHDPALDGADSSIFIAEAVRRCRDAGHAIGNMDITVICEQPKINAHKDKLLSNLSRVLECARSCINIKGKTHEKVDAVGEGRAIECHAVVLLVRQRD